jgi:hypothetical protein
MKPYIGVTFILSMPFSLATNPQCVAASPVNTMADLRCHCLIFDPPRPISHCNIENSHGISWDDAVAYASHNHVQIQFASEYTISKITDSELPVPTGILEHIGEVVPLSADYNSMDDKSIKFVCGIGDEVRERLMEAHGHHGVGEPDRFMIRVTLIIVLFIVLFAAGEGIWMR